MNYINVQTKKLVNEDGGFRAEPFIVDYNVVMPVSFTFLDYTLPQGATWYFAVGTRNYSTVVILSGDYTIQENTITFNVNSYTQQYLDNIKRKNTQVNLQLGFNLNDEKVILLRDTGLACPRVYQQGVSPQYLELDFYSKEEINSILNTNYWTKQETAAAIANVQTMKIVVVQELPPIAEAEEYTVYLVPAEDEQTNNVYNEYLLINGEFQLIGSTAVDLSQYVPKTGFDITSTSPTFTINSSNDKKIFFIRGDGNSKVVEIGNTNNKNDLPNCWIYATYVRFAADNVIYNNHLQNTAGGFVIQDANGVIGGATDVTITGGKSLSNSLQITGGTVGNYAHFNNNNATFGAGTAAATGNFYAYGSETNIRGLAVRIGWSDTSHVYHGNTKENTAGGFCISDATTGDLTLPGVLVSKGQKINTLSTTSFAPVDNQVFKYTLSADTAFTIDTTALTANNQINFELHLKQGATGYTPSFTNTIIWGDGDEFDGSNSMPTMTDANTTYALVFRWDGEDLLCNVAYKKVVAQ